jgi:heparan-alpha-glucosaminide N-acetyltransferase
LRTQGADPAIVVRERTRQLLYFGLFFLSLGVLLHVSDAIPFNKNLFSLSYISMMAGASSICLFIFWYLIDVKSIEKPFLPFIWQGMNAIFVFVLCACNVFDQIMQNFYWKTLDQNALDLFDAYLQVQHLCLRISPFTFDFLNIFSYLLLQDKCGVDGARVLYAFIKIAFWSVICGLLARFKIFFKV